MQLINIKMPTNVGILTFISRITQDMRVLKQEKSLYFGIVGFNSN